MSTRDVDGASVSVDNLSKVYHAHGGGKASAGSVYALNSVSFEVNPGECLGIAGESGSGKSTIARLLVGLERPSSGSVSIAGASLPPRPTTKDRRSHARRIQMVFQDPYSSLDPRLPVGSVLDEVQRVHFDRTKPERVTRSLELLDAVGLGGDYLNTVPRMLSGGQRQRLAIARALAAEPSILVLDEAVSALDVSIQAQILNLLSQLRVQLSLTYLFISHDLAVVRQVSDRVVILYRGSVMEDAPAEVVFESAKHPYTQMLLASVPRPDMVLVQRPVSAEASVGGCLFRDRCPKVFEPCIDEPELFEISADAHARCWLFKS